MYEETPATVATSSGQITAHRLVAEGGYFFLLNDRMTKIVVINDNTTPENCISCSKVM